jgi:hypothetical protein
MAEEKKPLILHEICEFCKLVIKPDETAVGGLNQKRYHQDCYYQTPEGIKQLEQNKIAEAKRKQIEIHNKKIDQLIFVGEQFVSKIRQCRLFHFSNDDFDTKKEEVEIAVSEFNIRVKTVEKWYLNRGG